jgi:hypothetical protein
LGQSIGSIHNVNGVPVQDYAKGSIFVIGNKTVAITGAIATYYRTNMTTLGLPTSEESTTSYGKSQIFQGALVTSSTQFGVHTLHGSIVGFYTGLTAAQKDQLGAATTEEAVGSDGNWQQFFKGGSVLWKSNGTGELKLTPYTIGFDGNTVNGAFTSKFNQVVGWTALGQPIGNVVSFNGGKLQDFAQGTICQLGNNVFLLQGQLGLYARNEMGTFGLPTSEQVTTSYGKKQEFQNGLVMCLPSGGIRTVEGNIWNYYRGLSATQQARLGIAGMGAAALNSDGNLQQSFTGGTIVWKKNGTGEVKFGAANIAPQAPVVNGIKSSYVADQTLSIDSGYAYDANGWQDVSKVDFWLTNSQNQRIELSDVNSFFYNSQNWAQFVYSTSLTGLAAGDYKLNEVAYDKAGAASNQSSQSFTIKAKNIAPQAPLVFGVKSSYEANSTLTIDPNSYVLDSNGWQDVSKVDFWLTNAQNQRIELTDATSFTPNANGLAKFNYSTSLAGFAAGDYKLSAIAYDKAGAASNQFSQAFAIKALNIAPQAPIITGIKSSYDVNSTLTIDSGYITDTNGWQDVSKVDFWLTNDRGVRVELSDVSDFAIKDANSARFSYATTLSGIAAGNYQLNAVAYDKAGIASNQFSQSLTIKDPNQDWFSLNLKDANTIALARTRAADGQLDRNDMIAIMRDMEDGSVVDTSEISDLKSLLATTTPFSISEPVRYLSNKVATEYSTNMSSTAFETNDLGKWFLGTIAPTAVFHDRMHGQTFNLQYEKAQGSLFGTSNQARIGDIDQGYFLGDCTLLASLGATFAPQINDVGNSISKTINDMLIDNGDNTYTVRFYTPEQKAEWVTVDNRLAKSELKKYPGQISFGSSNNDGLWAPIIEKACAQWREFNEGSSSKTGWDIIGNGDLLSPGLQRITGRSATSYQQNTSNDFTFNLIKDSLSQGKAITTGSWKPTFHSIDQNNPSNLLVDAPYLVGQHAYSVTNAYIDANGEQRVVVRNPWGIDYDWYTSFDSVNDGFLDLSYTQFRNFTEMTIS